MSTTTMSRFHGRVSAVKIDEIIPITIARYDRDMPRDAKKAFTRLIGSDHGIQVRRGRGTASKYIDVRIPAQHVQAQCTAGYQPDGTFVPMDRCKMCAAEHETERTIKRILYALFPGTDNRSDSQRDYFDFVWSVSTDRYM